MNAENLIANTFIDTFWLVASQLVVIIVPVIAIVLLFKILHYFLLRGD